MTDPRDLPAFLNAAINPSAFGSDEPLLSDVEAERQMLQVGGDFGGNEKGGTLRLILRAFTENKMAMIGLGLVVFVILFCFVGPLLYHTDQIHSTLNTNLRPSGQHPLGTDYEGFDILGRLMEGGQSSIEIGLAVALVATTFGVLWGAISGFFGGVCDVVMMRVIDVVYAIPAIFLFIFLASVYEPSLLMLIIVISALSWVGPARLIRGEALSVRTREYVQAARVMGSKSVRIILRHLVPNTMGTIVVNATFQIADAILLLATLSFLGFGLPPPTPSWGGMLSNGTNFLYDGYWWEIYPAGIAIVLTVIAFNFIGDALRDSLEVRLQKR
ncbi:MAG: ABC transporter permease [Acidimicrobiales bacterium]|jgi:peptide/nickel transport system permease protein